MLFNAPFAVSQNQADASYLEQLGLSFIALRLNVTPETVDAQHAQLLRYVFPGAQNSLKIQLAEDAKRIKDNNVNASFYMTSVRTYPAENRVDIRGELKTWIGDSAPYSEIKSYVLQFNRVDGVSWLARFGEINNEKINPLFLSGCLFFSLPAISATLSGTLAPTVVPLANGGQANIAVSNTDPNLFTVPGDRITAINSLDGGLTNQEQTDSGGAILATVSKNRSRLLWKPSAD
jgi:conjugal transfer pilus assembly protein TraE